MDRDSFHVLKLLKWKLFDFFFWIPYSFSTSFRVSSPSLRSLAFSFFVVVVVVVVVVLFFESLNFFLILFDDFWLVFILSVRDGAAAVACISMAPIGRPWPRRALLLSTCCFIAIGPASINFDWLFSAFQRIGPGFYWVLLGFTVFFRFLSGFTGFYLF